MAISQADLDACCDAEEEYGADTLERYAAARAAYAADCARQPTYHDGTPRKRWDDLGEIERYSWERNPTSRGAPSATRP